ncbi:12358_t:CDS:1, partial [Acaulospora morrowiae]
ACIKKDLLNLVSGETRCPISSCYKNVKIIKANVNLSPTRSDTRNDILVIVILSQDTNKITSYTPDIAKFIKKDNSTNENNNDPKVYNSKLVASKLTISIWVKEKLSQKLANANVNNNIDYKFIIVLGLIGKQIQTNQTSMDKSNIRAIIEATSVNKEQKQEYNTLNKKKSQLENLTGDQEQTITSIASVKDSIIEKTTSSLKHNNISETSTRLNIDEGFKSYKISYNNTVSTVFDKKDKKEFHVLKSLIEKLIINVVKVFENLPSDGNVNDFLYLY